MVMGMGRGTRTRLARVPPQAPTDAEAVMPDVHPSAGTDQAGLSGAPAVPHARRPRRWPPIALTCLALAVHAVLVVWLFGGWNRLTDPGQPCLYVDHAIHQYHGWLGAHFLRTAGRTWGYDPFFMAGYPKTPIYDSSCRPAELLALVAGHDWDPVVYKVGVALFMFLGVGLLALGAALGRLSAGAVLGTALFAAVYWWDGYTPALYVSGIYSFCLATSLGVASAMLLGRYVACGGWLNWLGMTVLAALSCLAHLTAPVVLAPAILIVYLVHSRRLGWRRHLGLWAAAGVVLAANAFWVITFLRFMWMKTPSRLFMQAHDPWYIVRDLFLSTRETAFLPLMIVLAVPGWHALRRAGQRGVAGVLAAGALTMALLAYFGSLVPWLRDLEPLRFKWALAAYLAPGAGAGAAWLVGRFRAAHGAPEPGSRGAGWVWWVVVVGLGVVFLRAGPLQHAVAGWRGQWALAAELPQPCRDLVQWIKENTDPSGRILFEDQLRLREATALESLHWTPLLPLLTGREYVGGLYHCGIIPYHHAAFGDFHIKGQANRQIDQVPEAELRAFCRMYNVGWVICWSPLSRGVFRKLDWAHPLATLPRPTFRTTENQWQIFRIDGAHSFFAVGSGRVRADYNRLELTDLVPDDDAIVLRYHWLDTLRTDPPLPIRCVKIPDDPVGFIRVEGLAPPPPKLVIYNSYRWDRNGDHGGSQ